LKLRINAVQITTNTSTGSVSAHCKISSFAGCCACRNDHFL